MRAALLATSEFRGSTLRALSEVVGSIAEERSATYRAFRARLGPDGDRLPDSFAVVVNAVVEFADPLIAANPAPGIWEPREPRLAALGDADDSCDRPEQVSID